MQRKKIVPLDEIFNDLNIPQSLLDAARENIPLKKLKASHQKLLLKFQKNLLAYYKDLMTHIPGGTTLLGDTLANIIPAIIPDIEIGNINEKLDILSKSDWFLGTSSDQIVLGDQTLISGEAAFYFTQLQASLITKIEEQKGEIPPLESKEVAHLLEEYEKSDRAETNRQRVIAHQMHHQLKQPLARIEILGIAGHLLNNIFDKAPEYLLKAPVGEKAAAHVLEEFNQAYHRLLNSDDPALAYYEIEVCEDLRDKLLLTLIRAIEMKIKSMPIGSDKFAEKAEEVIQYLSTLSKPTQPTTYQELAIGFMQRYLALNDEMRKGNTLYSEKSARALEISARHFPEKQFPFVMNASHFRGSKSKYVQAQVLFSQQAFTTKTIKDKQYIFSEKGDNLAQIIKDGQRDLRFQGSKVILPSDENAGESKTQKDKKIAQKQQQNEWRNFIRTQFGENAEPLMNHFNQRFTYLLSLALSANTQDEDGIPSQDCNFKQPPNLSDNLFSEQNIAFRETKLGGPEEKDAAILPIYVDGGNEEWKFKVNLKVLSWVSEDGYELTHLGTDSALVTNVLMQENGYPYLKSMVNAVQALEDELAKHFQHLEENKGSDLDFALLNGIKRQIAEFKNGQITFDELAKGIIPAAKTESIFKNTAPKRGSVFASLFGRKSKMTAPSSSKTALEEKVWPFINELLRVKSNLDSEALIITQKALKPQEFLQSLNTGLEIETKTIKDMNSSFTNKDHNEKVATFTNSLNQLSKTVRECLSQNTISPQNIDDIKLAILRTLTVIQEIQIIFEESHSGSNLQSLEEQCGRCQEFFSRLVLLIPNLKSYLEAEEHSEQKSQDFSKQI